MSNFYVLIAVIVLRNGYAHTRDDRYYFQLILREFERYPILKQTLIQYCWNNLDKCKRNEIFRSSIRMFHHRKKKKKIDDLFRCFIDSQQCYHPLLNHEIFGHVIRKRSCKFNRRCSMESNGIEMKDCQTGSCPDEHSNQNHERLIFIILFPLVFTLICLPLCLLYYIYEIDFKTHAWFMYGFSQCNQCCKTTSSNNRRRGRRRINII